MLEGESRLEELRICGVGDCGGGFGRRRVTSSALDGKSVALSLNCCQRQRCF